MRNVALDHRFSRTMRALLLTVLLFAPLLASADTTVFGTLKAERHGERGPAVILIPGLQGGPWVWKETIERLQADHVVYAITLAGFDGMPAPKAGGNLFDRADGSLLQLITREHIGKPVLVGHSLGGTLALRFASEHPDLISGVVAVDGLPIFPGMERISAGQRQAIAAKMQQQMAASTQQQFSAQSLQYMQRVGLVDQPLAARYAPMNARSDIKASAQYMAEDLASDLRPGLKHASVPILEISPYYAPDFSQPPMVMSESQKTAYYESLLTNAPNATVVSISPSRHFVMLDQPQAFHHVLADFLETLRSTP